MKAKLSLAIVGVATVLTLTACGGHDDVKAVDKLAEAEAAAKAAAPKAESITFDDAGQPTVGGVGGEEGANADNPPESAEHIANDIATANAQTIAHHGQAETATTEGETAKAEEKADTAEAEATAEAPKAEETAEAEATAEAPKAETKSE